MPTPDAPRAPHPLKRLQDLLARPKVDGALALEALTDLLKIQDDALRLAEQQVERAERRTIRWKNRFQLYNPNDFKRLEEEDGPTGLG